jgi:hypothetical protein
MRMALHSGAATLVFRDLHLAPGATVCLTPQYANSYADAQGIANDGGAHFTVYNGAVNATNVVYMVFNAIIKPYLGKTRQTNMGFWSNAPSADSR